MLPAVASLIHLLVATVSYCTFFAFSPSKHLLHCNSTTCTTFVTTIPTPTPKFTGGRRAAAPDSIPARPNHDHYWRIWGGQNGDSEAHCDLRGRDREFEQPSSENRCSRAGRRRDRSAAGHLTAAGSFWECGHHQQLELEPIWQIARAQI